jgi:hypothetical protein
MTNSNMDRDSLEEESSKLEDEFEVYLINDIAEQFPE